jgi:hypothetical protein
MTGNTREDLQHAALVLRGLITPLCNAPVRALQSVVGTDYDMIVELLNGVYDNNCSVYVTEAPPLLPTTYAYCSEPKGYATMTAGGATNQVPKTLVVCHGDAATKRWCEAIELTGEKAKDLPAAKKILGNSK